MEVSNIVKQLEDISISILGAADKLAQQGEAALAGGKALSSEVLLKSTELLGSHDAGGVLMAGLGVFVLACFVGYYVVWNVTPALHSPLMSVTNAVSSVIVVGAIIAAGAGVGETSSVLGLFAVFLASINIVGGFVITWRMLSMFRRR